MENSFKCFTGDKQVPLGKHYWPAADSTAKEGRDGKVEGSEELRPLGWFHAVKTRDAVAQTRDGWPYFEIEARGTDTTGATLVEIRFGDGEWMLAVTDDLLPRDR